MKNPARQLPDIGRDAVAPTLLEVVEAKLESSMSQVVAVESRINESLARQEKAAAERESRINESLARQEKAAVEREKTAAERESQRFKEFVGVVGVAAVIIIGAVGLMIQLTQRPDIAPVTVNIPPMVQSAAPAATPPVVGGQ